MDVKNGDILLTSDGLVYEVVGLPTQYSSTDFEPTKAVGYCRALFHHVFSTLQYTIIADKIIVEDASPRYARKLDDLEAAVMRVGL